MATYAAPYPTQRGAGWVTFAGIMLTLAGVLDIVHGIRVMGFQDTAVDTFFFLDNAEAWGWFYIILGIVLVIVGFGVFGGATWAAVVGIVVAAIAAVLHMLWVFRYPIVSLILMTLDILVIYALSMYGGKEKTVVYPAPGR
jgi:hypothetical protein